MSSAFRNIPPMPRAGITLPVAPWEQAAQPADDPAPAAPAEQSAAGRPWSEREDATLSAMAADGATLADMADRLRRTKGACEKRAGLIGVTLVGRRLWTPRELARLRALYEQGYNSPDIAGMLDRSTASVRNRLNRLGLSQYRGRCWEPHRADIEARRAAGESIASIAASYDRTEDTVARIIRDWNRQKQEAPGQ